jgi:hypothetical protein
MAEKIIKIEKKKLKRLSKGQRLHTRRLKQEARNPSIDHG